MYHFCTSKVYANIFAIAIDAFRLGPCGYSLSHFILSTESDLWSPGRVSELRALGGNEVRCGLLRWEQKEKKKN
jgi:hypothetical protein